MSAIRMKPGYLLLSLLLYAGAICAEQTDSCAGLAGAGLTQCQTQQTLRQQERLELLLQQQQERQTELDKQQREVQQQLESMRLQNESLRRQLESEAVKQPERPGVTSYSKSQDVKNWKADNLWFGSDYAKTQFAMRYIKQLQQERPDLSGRELLDALSGKVNETFGSKN